MTDPAHERTDDMIGEIRQRVSREYLRAYEETEAKLADYLRRFEAKDRIHREAVERGEETQADYTEWRRGQILVGKRWQELVDTLAEDYRNADRVAASIVNGHAPDAYALNHDYATFQVEKGSNLDTSYTLYDRATVERLIRDQPDLLPAVKVDGKKDLAWNRRHIASAITQGVLQGESMDKVARRVRSVADMDYRAAMRTARTAMTSAQNAGREAAYRRAEGMGIHVRKQWLATLDGRTRHSHRRLDGEVVGMEESFSNGLSYPGDPGPGMGSEVYNCRCTLVPVVDGADPAEGVRHSNLGGVSYEQWRNGHAAVSRAGAGPHTVAQGRNIVGKWKRRADQFDFEIEDVMDAQGYDGVPRLVDADEFDELVKNSGMVMQRVYSSDNEKVLDEYRRALYEGKWYVDCSVNGATHGQGMYCAPSWTGRVSDEVKESMRFYADFNARTGKEFSYVETMTMAKDSKTISWDDLHKKFMDYKENRRGALMDSGPSDLGRGREEYVRRMLRDAGVPDGSVDDATTFLVGSSGLVPKDWDEMGEARGRLTQEVLNVVNSKRGDLSSRSMEIDDFARNYSQSDSSVPVEIEDPGSYAVMMGYDAVVVQGSGLGNEIVVLNRTKVVIKRPRGWR